MEKRGDQLWDCISDAPCSTEFAISRFLVPHLARSGWALFLDADMMARGNLCRLFEEADARYAVMVVKHEHEPKNEIKMDGQMQTTYLRKNWSSLMLFNVDHPSNDRLTPKLVNTVPGRDLHRFCWLDDDEIGELHVKWNYLVGHSLWPNGDKLDPQVVHFTDGMPYLPGYEDIPFAGEWRVELELCS